MSDTQIYWFICVTQKQSIFDTSYVFGEWLFVPGGLLTVSTRTWYLLKPGLFALQERASVSEMQVGALYCTCSQRLLCDGDNVWFRTPHLSLIIKLLRFFKVASGPNIPTRSAEYMLSPSHATPTQNRAWMLEIQHKGVRLEGPNLPNRG
jgi:hypothetical protein